MAISFEDFFKQYSSSRVNSCSLLIQNPPSAEIPVECPHFSPIYQSLLLDENNRLVLQSAYWLLRFYTSPLLFPSYDLATQFQFWGEIATHKDIAQRQMLILNGLLFQFTHIGNSHVRACYSAIQLYEMLKSSELKFYVKSFKAHNHMVVYIKKAADWYVYDPMLNPDFIFNIEEYRQNVVKYLSVNEEKTPEMKQRIDKKTHEGFVETSLKFHHYLQNLIDHENPGHVLANPYYQSYFQHLSLGKLEEITEKAIKKLKQDIYHPQYNQSFIK
jgi:hypothetical protein